MDTPMSHPPEDPFNLNRFLVAQENDYARALTELCSGQKLTHWMWYILPQLRGLGSSSMATFYGIGSKQEAQAYLAHPVLGSRLKECVAAMNALGGRDTAEVLGEIDAAKFRSCLTLFASVKPEEPLFGEALLKYFSGVPDVKSIALLKGLQREAPPHVER